MMNTTRRTRTPNQLRKISKFLSSGKTLTRSEAMRRFGTKNLPSAISKLKQEGWNITRSTVTRKGQKVSAYRYSN